MTQNAADMMELIQETLNQADEEHSRRMRGDGVRHHHVRGLSLAESSRPRAHDHARLDAAELPGPGIRHSVNSEDLTDLPPLVDAQSLQLHLDHQCNEVVNPKSLSYGVVTGETNEAIDPRPKSSTARPHVGQLTIKKTNVPSSIMDKSGTDRRRTKRKRCRATSSERTHSPEPPARPVPRTPAPAPVSPCVVPFSSPESLPPLLVLTLMLAIQELPLKYLAHGQRKMTSSFAA